MKRSVAVFWFRRDLRLNDNAGLYNALQQGHPVLPIFIFDTAILSKLPAKRDARVEFIHRSLQDLKQTLQSFGSDLLVLHGEPETVWKKLLSDYNVSAVFANRDYEPYAKTRDRRIDALLSKTGIQFKTFKDHCIFECDEVLKADGTPYTVYTPYANKWKERLKTHPIQTCPSESLTKHFLKTPAQNMPTLESLGFESAGLPFPPKTVKAGLIKDYKDKRNFPALDASSHLSVHFRFGTISIREKALKALELSEIWLNELIWRDFYIQIMAHFPHAMQSAFKPAYDRIAWRNKPEEFEAWCKGKTGYPLVDAGMRELNATGFMHNRVRMVVSSFLCKHLLIDWRWGEAYFAEKLLDFELASNNGGWQWAAGSGVDAAPYFRIFNPALQTERFDKDHVYIRRWVPEYGSSAYPAPIVEHSFARKRCLEVYKEALNAV